MPVRTVPGADLTYYLIAFDDKGRERQDDGSLLSEALVHRVRDRTEAVTDVFIASHGWKGDVPAAISQYDRWVAAMAAQESDREAASALLPGFTALIVGLHWPSLPWGDERLPGPGALLSADAADDHAGTTGHVVDVYADRIADTPGARAALAVIVESARNADTAEVSPRLRVAYAALYAESGLGSGATSAPPGADQDDFDPELIIDEARRLADRQQPDTGTPGLLGGSDAQRIRDLLMMPVRQLSFWKMKDRARRFGEGGAHDLLRSLQLAAPHARFHLMGHSFGAIVATGAVVGPPDGGLQLPRSVESLFLVQGAFSLWSVCPDVPFAPGTPGYFSRLLADGLVRGPIVTTRSDKDTAVGRFYPLGAQVKRQLLLEPQPYPQYGGVGAFGFQGLGSAAQDLPVQGPDHAYAFRGGLVYNVEATRVIANGSGSSGAHSDITHPEIAHLQWQAVMGMP